MKPRKLTVSAFGPYAGQVEVDFARLGERGLFQNSGGVVTALMSREEYYAQRSERFVQESFSGSLPAFMAAFTSRKRLSEQEIDELQALIDKMRG